MWTWPIQLWAAETKIFGNLNNSVLSGVGDAITYLCATAGSLAMAQCYQRQGATRSLSVKRKCIRNNGKDAANGKQRP